MRGSGREGEGGQKKDERESRKRKPGKEKGYHLFLYIVQPVQFLHAVAARPQGQVARRSYQKNKNMSNNKNKKIRKQKDIVTLCS